MSTNGVITHGVPAADIKTLSKLTPHLCSRACAGLTRPHKKRIEFACASCECRCAYGQRWLDIYWGEQDREWEKQQEARKQAEAAKKIDQLKGELAEMKLESALYRAGEANVNGWIRTAMRPKYKRV